MGVKMRAKKWSKTGLKVVRKRYLTWNKSMEDFEVWRTKKDAEKGKKEERYDKGWIEEICNIKSFIGFIPSKTKVTEVTFKTLKD